MPSDDVPSDPVLLDQDGTRDERGEPLQRRSSGKNAPPRPLEAQRAPPSRHRHLTGSVFSPRRVTVGVITEIGAMLARRLVNPAAPPGILLVRDRREKFAKEAAFCYRHVGLLLRRLY
ncbi:hypothetical protein EYF80_056346 [Liparis tanakae]|uniref:Uncharacterized protein n=1 Tax=Liparis tanakae TaxID=230148 RepID=A0A4Z2EZ30_9TELE|nr:hypothetical protein EYF80_056346 [Liparis tanakae]